MSIALLKNTFVHQKALTLALISSVLFFGGLYMYFVSVAIVEVVVRTEISQDINALSSEISELESAYIKAQHKVSSSVASLQGYKKSSDKIFIDRSEDSLVLKTTFPR